MRVGISVFLVLGFLGSCDIPGRIVIQNKSGGPAAYREFIQQDSLRIFAIELNNERNHNEADIMFGFGHFWNDVAIQEYVQTINKIEIISSGDTLLLSGKKEMFDFFRKRRRGLFKQTIVIKIH